MRDENLIAIAMQLSEICTDILLYLESKSGEQVDLTSLYKFVEDQGQISRQKVQDEVQQLRVALLVKTSRNVHDNRVTNITITTRGQKLLELGRKLTGAVKPNYNLDDEVLHEMSLQLDKSHIGILKVLRDAGIDRSEELYIKATKRKISYRVFQCRVAALRTSLLIDTSEFGRCKSFQLTENGKRYIDLNLTKALASTRGLK